MKDKKQIAFLKSLKKVQNRAIDSIKKHTETVAQLIETPRTTIMTEQMRRIKKKMSDLEKENEELRETLSDVLATLQDSDKKFQEVLYLLKKRNSY